MATDVQSALTTMLTTSGIECLELEWRIGRHGPAGFQPGITSEQWHALLRYFDRATCWDAVRDSKTTEKVAGNGSKLVNGAVWNHKKRIFDADFAPFVRVSGSTEILEQAAPDAESRLPPTVFTRFKERRSYVFKCWSFDLTKVVSTADIDTDVCTYEVEVELVNKDELFVRPVSNIVEWGHALMIDIIHILKM